MGSRLIISILYLKKINALELTAMGEHIESAKCSRVPTEWSACVVAHSAGSALAALATSLIPVQIQSVDLGL